MRPAVLVVALACNKVPEGEGAQFHAADYLAPQGSYLELAPIEDPTGATLLMIRADAEDAWTLRTGASWVEGIDAGTVAVSVEDGLTLDGETLLPATVAPGETAGDSEVVSIDDWETYYGTFAHTAVVEVSAGRFTGTNAFAQDHGPVTLSVDGATWDLVYYE